MCRQVQRFASFQIIPVTVQYPNLCCTGGKYPNCYYVRVAGSQIITVKLAGEDTGKELSVGGVATWWRRG
jgi:hypothetical protein